MSENTSSPHGRPAEPTRRTIVKGAAWSVPVIAAAVAAPLASASPTDRFDLVYVNGPVVNTNRVARGQTPFVDFTFQSVGPDPAPNAQITFSVPSANNNPSATAALNNNNSGMGTGGWVILTSFQSGGRDYYTFLHSAELPVGQYTVRWAHVVGGPVNTSYTMNANLEVTPGETNGGNNGGTRGSAQIFVVA